MRKTLYFIIVLQAVLWITLGAFVVKLSVKFNELGVPEIMPKLYAPFILCMIFVSAACVILLMAMLNGNTNTFFKKFEELVKLNNRLTDMEKIIRSMIWKIGQHESQKLVEEEFKELDKLKEKYEVK